jgi:Domain of unknown function (DUF6457)
MDAQDWIAEFARGLGVAPPDDETFETLLELAGVAAHASERIAAPIACYLVGLVRVDPERALELARTLAGDDA